ncbi:MAG: hypothetical protein ACE5I1_32545 [bacterium]
MKIQHFTIIILTFFLILTACNQEPLQNTTSTNSQPSEYEVDPFWPKPLPNNWILGQVSGVAVDSRDHIWIVQRPRTLTPREAGAVQEPPVDEELPDYDPEAEPIRSFRSPMHAVRISNDGLVYAADRVNNRIQVFQKDGTFVKEGFVAKKTLAMGSVWDIELSRDETQKYMFIPDGTNQKVWILERTSLEVVGSFGRGGRYAGQLGWVHNIAMDSKGNLYTTEVETGKRVQRFRMK